MPSDDDRPPLGCLAWGVLAAMLAGGALTAAALLGLCVRAFRWAAWGG